MVINQFASHGDILFIEPICRRIWENTGEKPILPVRDHLMWFEHYIDSARFVPMSEFSLDYDSMAMDNPDYLPLRFANQIVRKLACDDHTDYANMMPDKYLLSGLPVDLWKNIRINRNPERENDLFKALNLSPKDQYILINENSQAGKISIIPKRMATDKVIRMSVIEGFTLLDWLGIIEHARENHHVSTSTFFLMEFLKVEMPVFMYPRPNNDGLQGISRLNSSFSYTAIA